MIAVPERKIEAEAVTESEEEIETEKILLIGKVQENLDDAEAGLGAGTGNGKGTDIETDIADPWLPSL